MHELILLSRNNIQNAPSRRQSILRKFDTEYRHTVWRLDTSISIPFDPTLVKYRINYVIEQFLVMLQRGQRDAQRVGRRRRGRTQPNAGECRSQRLQRGSSNFSIWRKKLFAVFFLECVTRQIDRCVAGRLTCSSYLDDWMELIGWTALRWCYSGMT